MFEVILKQNVTLPPFVVQRLFMDIWNL